VSEEDPRVASVSELERRMAAVDAALASLLTSPPELPSLPDAAARRIVTTGVGASEGPARFLAETLRTALGLRARFAPLSAFTAGPPPHADAVVVFSQGLSPNARLPLAACRALPHRALFTSIDPARDAGERADFVRRERRDGLAVCSLPPGNEGGMLLRVIGPVVALAASMLWVERLCSEASVAAPFPGANGLPAALAQARARARRSPVDLLAPRLALVAAGSYLELCHGLRSKLLEGLLCPEPALWDIMGLAHGAFQQFHDGAISLLVLEAPSAVQPWITDRLRRMIEPSRHSLSVLDATLPGPGAVLEHDAQLNEHLLWALRRAPRDLTRWPGQGADAPLYDLGG
jgi:hypothetical protein